MLEALKKLAQRLERGVQEARSSGWVTRGELAVFPPIVAPCVFAAVQRGGDRPSSAMAAAAGTFLCAIAALGIAALAGFPVRHPAHAAG